MTLAQLLLAVSPSHPGSTDWTLIWAAIGAIAVVLGLLFDNGVLIRGLNVINNGYEWEVRPFRAPGARKVETRISHGYSSPRYLRTAAVVVPQRLFVRILWFVTHGQRLERWIVAADLLNGTERELRPNQGTNLSGELESLVPLPTWRLWRPLKLEDPTNRRLLTLLRFDRRSRVVARPVREARGSTQPAGTAHAA